MRKKINVLIADDEPFVREGIKYLIDWEAAGYTICGEAKDGVEALEKIRILRPGLVILDIRMPGMDGTEVMQKAREIGFRGEFLILSGFSDFSYAKAAIQYGAADYIVKPIDEMQLLKVVTRLAGKIREEMDNEQAVSRVLGKARSTVLSEILLGRGVDPDINYDDYGLNSVIYQVVIYESFIPNTQITDFAQLLMLSSDDRDAVDSIELGGRNVILLKSQHALERFQSWLYHCNSEFQKNSLIDSIFLVYGEEVHSLQEVRRSYEECVRLIQRRFYCSEEQHVLSWEDLPKGSGAKTIDPEAAGKYAALLTDSVRTFNRMQTAQYFDALRTYFSTNNFEVLQVQHFMIDLLLRVKANVQQALGGAEKDLIFDSNTAIIENVENASYFNDIISYFMQQFEKVMVRFRCASSDSVIDDILYYVDQNYASKITLEGIGPLFGYNSAYLGKLFNSRMGMNFNAYHDKVRIDKSKELLENTDLKIFIIAERVGYRNVDVYNQKFRKQEGMSPSEFRKRVKKDSES